jgi:hypothetical protein
MPSLYVFVTHCFPKQDLHRFSNIEEVGGGEVNILKIYSELFLKDIKNYKKEKDEKHMST